MIAKLQAYQLLLSAFIGFLRIDWTDTFPDDAHLLGVECLRVICAFARDFDGAVPFALRIAINIVCLMLNTRISLFN